MAQKIDIFGLAIVPEEIVNLGIANRNAIYYPCFQEVQASRSLFGLSSSRKKLQFVNMVPYAIQLGPNEHPKLENYIMDTDAGKIFQHITTRVGKKLDDAEHMVMNALHIDTSGNQEFKVMFMDRTMGVVKLRDIPAKVKLLSGQYRDIPRSSDEYDFGGGGSEPITNMPVKALVIQTTENVHMLFSGFDIPEADIDPTYKKLLEIHNQIEAAKEQMRLEKKSRPLINISLPKLELPKAFSSIKLQSPISFGRKIEREEAKLPESTKDEE